MDFIVSAVILNRDVQIQISNKTKTTLTNPRVHLHHGHSSCPPSPLVPPGHEDSCQFTNYFFVGCEGILTYEAESFTMAIYFCNPTHYYLNPIALGLEISLEKIHLQVKPADIFAQMENGHHATYRVSASNRVTVSDSQKAAQVSANHIRIMATMSNNRSAIIRVVVEEWEGSGRQGLGK